MKNETNMLEQQLSQATKDLSPEAFTELLLNIVKSRPDSEPLTEALIVRLANTTETSMYGRTVHDEISSNQKGRHEYDIHPYGKMGAGAHVVVTYQNKGKIYFLLGRKEKKIKKSGEDDLDFYILPGGYVKPHPLEGGDKAIASYNSEQKDAIEEELLLGKTDAYAKSDAVLSKNYHEKIYDNDLRDTALRELLEETGLIATREALQSLATCSKHAITNDKRLHTVVETFLLNLGEKSIPPVVSPGSDLKMLEWVPASAISKNTNIPVQESRSEKSRYSVKTNNVFVQDGAGALMEKALEVIKKGEKSKDTFLTWTEKVSQMGQKHARSYSF